MIVVDGCVCVNGVVAVVACAEMSSKRDAAVEEAVLVRRVAVPTLPVVMHVVGDVWCRQGLPSTSCGQS